MKKIRIILPCLLLCLFFLSSCGHSKFDEQTLSIAESLMQERPDSTLALLSPYQLKDIKGKENRAKFALLYSQALDKNYIDITDDSLIRVAVNYYDDQNDDDSKSMAHYYLARVYDNAGNVDNAIKHLVIAKEFISEKDCYQHGMIYNTLAHKYHYQYNFESAIQNYEYAAETYERCGRMDMAGEMFICIAEQYLFQDEHSKALSFYYKALTVFESLDNKGKVLLIHSFIATTQLYMDTSTKEIKAYLKKAYKEYNNDITPLHDYTIWSQIYLKENRLNDSRRYLINILSDIDSGGSRMSSNQKAGIYAQLKNVESKAGNYKLALGHNEKYVSIIDSIQVAENKLLVQELEQRYRNDLLKETNNSLVLKQKYRELLGLLVIIIFVSAIVIVIISRKNAIKRKNKEIEEYKNSVEFLESAKESMSIQNEKLMADKSDKDEREKLFDIAFAKRLQVVSKLANDAYLYEGNPKKFQEKVSKHIVVDPKDDTAFLDLQYAVNKKNNGIIDHLNAEYPKLTSFDLDLCSLICLGFPNDAIRGLYGHRSKDSLYNKRSRLKINLGLPQNASLGSFLKETIAELAKTDSE